jgi:3-oxoadipate enol-lactonase
MASVQVAGMVLESEGEGPPVVMLHGLGGTSNTFQPLLSWLAGFRIIRPDLPGSGRSPPPPHPITLGLLLDALDGALSHLGIGRAHLVGHSFGAFIAQHFAALHPQKLASLVLFGPVIEPQEGARERLRQRAAVARHEGMGIVAENSMPSALAGATVSDHPLAVAFVRESHMRQNPEGYAQSCEALARAEKADHGRIECPALIVTGEDDPIAPPSIARELADKIRGAKTVILHRCGHWTPIEKVKECGTLLSDFLRGIPV